MPGGPGRFSREIPDLQGWLRRDVLTPVQMPADQGVITLSGQVPLSQWRARPSIATVTLSGLVPKGRSLAKPSIGVLTLSGLDAFAGTSGGLPAAVMTLSGMAPTFKRRATPTTGVITLSGQVPKGRWRFITTSFGTFTVSGLTIAKLKTGASPATGRVNLSGLVPKGRWRATPSTGVINLPKTFPNFGRTARPSVGIVTLPKTVPLARKGAVCTTGVIYLSGNRLPRDGYFDVDACTDLDVPVDGEAVLSFPTESPVTIEFVPKPKVTS